MPPRIPSPLEHAVTQAYQDAQRLRASVDKALSLIEAFTHTAAPSVLPNTPDNFWEALKRGDLAYFKAQYHDDPEIQALEPSDKPQPITRETLHRLYPGAADSNKFGRLMGAHGLSPQPIRTSRGQVRGLYITWR